MEYPTGGLGPSVSPCMEFNGAPGKGLLLMMLLALQLLTMPTGECVVGIVGEKGLLGTLGL